MRTSKYLGSNTLFGRNYKRGIENSRSKINSLFYNLSQENRISSAELEDYNFAASSLVNCFRQVEKEYNKLEEVLLGALRREELFEDKAKKYYQLLILTGLKPEGIMDLEVLPLVFLRNVLDGLDNFPAVVHSELYYQWIQHRIRYAKLMIERDMSNINTIKLYKRIYRNGNKAIQDLSRGILQQIAEESKHIAEDIRRGLCKQEILKKSEKYWYERA